MNGRVACCDSTVRGFLYVRLSLATRNFGLIFNGNLVVGCVDADVACSKTLMSSGLGPEKGPVNSPLGSTKGAAPSMTKTLAAKARLPWREAVRGGDVGAGLDLEYPGVVETVRGLGRRKCSH